MIHCFKKIIHIHRESLLTRKHLRQNICFISPIWLAIKILYVPFTVNLQLWIIKLFHFYSEFWHHGLCSPALMWFAALPTFHLLCHWLPVCQSACSHFVFLKDSLLSLYLISLRLYLGELYSFFTLCYFIQLKAITQCHLMMQRLEGKVAS